jgi:hypothetical protein
MNRINAGAFGTSKHWGGKMAKGDTEHGDRKTFKGVLQMHTGLQLCTPEATVDAGAAAFVESAPAKPAR